MHICIYTYIHISKDPESFRLQQPVGPGIHIPTGSQFPAGAWNFRGRSTHGKRPSALKEIAPHWERVYPAWSTFAKNHGKSQLLMGKLTISMAMFNSYVTAITRG